MLSRVLKRSFSRNYADKGRAFEAGLHKQASKQQFIERELKENPEFFKAFPHL